MIGLNTIFTNNVAGFLDLEIIELLEDLILDGGKDYAPTYTLDFYDNFNTGLVSSCSEGKESVLYAKDFDN